MAGDMWSDPSKFFDGAMELYKQFSKEAEQQEEEFRERHPDGVEIEFTDGEKITVGGRESASKIIRGREVMTTTRKKVARVVKQKQPQRDHPGKNVEVKVEVTIMVSTGAGDPRSIEEIREDIKADLMNPKGKTRAKLVTNMGGYYLVDGKVCLPDDYDPKTRGFKPGAHPPLWAMAPDEREILKRIEREKATRPPMARNPENLRTTAETDALDAKEKRIAKVGEALRDLHENTEWGKRKAEEAAQSASDDDEFEEDEFSFDEDDEEEPYFDEDEEDGDIEGTEEDEDFEAEWDEDDPMNDEVAEEAVEQQTSSALAKLKNGKSSRKVVMVPKPTIKKKVVRRR